MPICSSSPSDGADARSRIPATDALLAVPELAGAAERLGRHIVKDVIITTQERARRGEITPDEITNAAIGSLPDEAYVRLRAAEQQLSTGRGAEAKAQLQHALAFYRQVAATGYLRQADELVAASA